MIKAICVFCGSSAGNSALYTEAAEKIGTLIAQRGLTLVYGGAARGLMHRVANAALSARGRVTGVIPQALVDKEIAHPGLTEMHVVNTMHERKALMADLSDAFVALPGGLGTWDEFCEIVTWSLLGLHNKPCGILNTAGYYDPMLAMMDRAVAEGFVKAQQRDEIRIAGEPERIIELLLSESSSK